MPSGQLENTRKSQHGKHLANSPEEYELEMQQLFAQPYIDPLTRYLRRYSKDAARSPQLSQIRQERDRRCAAVAERYASAPLTATALEKYRAGYSFSCPADVEDYAGRLRSQVEDSSSSAESETGAQQVARIPTQQLNDCYLLTEIRNFSEALKACRVPAEAGDLQAQSNMAQIAHAFQDHAVAYRWARQAAPDSPDAAFLLGQLYAEGDGVEQDAQAAETWYAKAARQGHAGAKAALVERSDVSAVTTFP